MNCPKCNTANGEESRFCGQCRSFLDPYLQGYFEELVDKRATSIFRQRLWRATKILGVILGVLAFFGYRQWSDFRAGLGASAIQIEKDALKDVRAGMQVDAQKARAESAAFMGELRGQLADYKKQAKQTILHVGDLTKRVQRESEALSAAQNSRSELVSAAATLSNWNINSLPDSLTVRYPVLRYNLQSETGTVSLLDSTQGWKSLNDLNKEIGIATGSSILGNQSNGLGVIDVATPGMLTTYRLPYTATISSSPLVTGESILKVDKQKP